MIHNLFSTPIYKINVVDVLRDANSIDKIVRESLNVASAELSSLEKHGGKSTYATNNQLHTSSGMQELRNLILLHSKMYWKILDIDQRLSPRIDQCWTNVHKSGSFTVQHSHSLMPMVATFYLKAEKNCGDLILTNPAEYGITNIPFSRCIEEKIETAIKVSTGDIIFFPGYIRHKTGENFSGEDRIVVSFNIGYSGEYLSSNVEYPNIAVNHPVSEVEHLYNKILNLEFIIQNLKENLTNEK